MRLRAAAIPLTLAALGLAACQPQADDGTPATEPASAPAQAPAAAKPPVPAAFRVDLDARGTEPFWSLQIRKKSLVLQRPDASKLTLPNDGPFMENGKVTWAEGKLVAFFTEAACSDGMSDKTYPFTAEVQAGQDTYKGCAEPAAGN